MPTSPPAQIKSLFEPGQFAWWAGGVIVAAALLALAAPLVHAKLTDASAWFLALGSAVGFLSCLDDRGNFRPLRFVAAAVVLVVVYRFTPSVQTAFPPKLVLVLIVALLLFVYSGAGALGVAIGKAWTGDSLSKAGDA